MKEVQQFLNFIKNIYKEFPKNINLVFNFKPQIKVHDISDINKNNGINKITSSNQHDGTNISSLDSMDSNSISFSNY